MSDWEHLTCNCGNKLFKVHFSMSKATVSCLCPLCCNVIKLFGDQNKVHRAKECNCGGVCSEGDST